MPDLPGSSRWVCVDCGDTVTIEPVTISRDWVNKARKGGVAAKRVRQIKAEGIAATIKQGG
jgi:hypothetical protein